MNNDKLDAPLLIEYWHKIKGYKSLPLESEIELDDIGGIRKDCFFTKARHIIEDKSNIKYSYLGDNIKKILKGSNTSPIREALAKDLLKIVKEAIKLKKPAVIINQIKNGVGVLNYSLFALPFAHKEANKVSFVLGSVKWVVSKN